MAESPPSMMFDVLIFTVTQAFCSTLISVGLSFGLSRCFAYQNPGAFYHMVLNLPFLTPAIVGLLGFILLFKSGGLLGDVISLYGIQGIITAHVIFYTPYMTLFLWQGWREIPSEHHKLSDQLGLSGCRRFWLVEYPLLKPYLITITWMSFCLFTASFATVFTLGGGPSSTTLPVALFQSLFHDFDLEKAIMFAALQTGSCVLFYGLNRYVPKKYHTPSGGTPYRRSSVFNWLGVNLTLGISLLPLVILMTHTTFEFTSIIWSPLLKSLQIGSLTGFLTVGIAWGILSQRARTWIGVGTAVFFIPSSLIGFALFMGQIYGGWMPSILSVIVINIFICLPFVLQSLKDPYDQADQTYRMLIQSVGANRHRMMTGLLRQHLAKAWGFSSALAAGDLSALLMFSDHENPGLSALIYQQLGGYKSGEAMTSAFVLMALCLVFISVGLGLGRDIFNVKNR